MTEYKKEDDCTLLVTNTLPSGGTLCRYFNFEAEQVTVIFSQKTDKSAEAESSGYQAVSTSVSVATALTSQMQIQNFSSFDSMAEIERLHAVLEEQGGHPPALNEHLTNKIVKSPGVSLGH